VPANVLGIEVIWLEKYNNVTDVDNEVSLRNKPISDPRIDDSEKECNLPNKLDVVSRQLTRGDGVYIDGAVALIFNCWPLTFTSIRSGVISRSAELTLSSLKQSPHKKILRKIFEEMFKVKETGNHLYNAARQNLSRAPSSSIWILAL
jgi:hypothetical protein